MPSVAKGEALKIFFPSLLNEKHRKKPWWVIYTPPKVSHASPENDHFQDRYLGISKSPFFRWSMEKTSGVVFCWWAILSLCKNWLTPEGPKAKGAQASVEGVYLPQPLGCTGAVVFWSWTRFCSTTQCTKQGQGEFGGNPQDANWCYPPGN